MTPKPKQEPEGDRYDQLSESEVREETRRRGFPEPDTAGVDTLRQRLREADAR